MGIPGRVIAMKVRPMRKMNRPGWRRGGMGFCEGCRPGSASEAENDPAGKAPRRNGRVMGSMSMWRPVGMSGAVF